MIRLDGLFDVQRGISGLFSDYQAGKVAYVGNTTENNGVVGYVEQLDGDRVFQEAGIAVSAFCAATVQLPPFIACGRAGNGVSVLVPRTPMSMQELFMASAHINISHRWRFSWYRQTTTSRLKPLQIVDPRGTAKPLELSKLLPATSTGGGTADEPTWKEWLLSELFDLEAGEYHSAANLPPGATPLVSCGDMNNGVIAHVSAKHTHRNVLTIALNGSPLTAKVHPYTFAAKDDVAVCEPRMAFPVPSLLFVQAALERERWRYSYYRKCYLEKLRRFKVWLPVKGENVDHDWIAGRVAATAYGPYVVERMLSVPATS